MDKLPQLQLTPGTYILAVSGGVDSMVLLDLFLREKEVQIVVAHVDHGIRGEESRQDREFVEKYTMSHNIEFEVTELHLGASASEATARQARYAFLRQVCKKYNALAIVTAHHQDDLVETAVINLLRGTGFRGLASLRSQPDLLRPFLNVPKSALVAYAKHHGLKWREDHTNTEQTYLRNFVRHTVLPAAQKVDPHFCEQLLQAIQTQHELVESIEAELEKYKKSKIIIEEYCATLSRYELIMLPPPVAHEILQKSIKAVSGSALPRPLISRALTFIKSAKPQKVFELSREWQIRAGKSEIFVEPRGHVIS